jgi:hypothetical protein
MRREVLLPGGGFSVDVRTLHLIGIALLSGRSPWQRGAATKSGAGRYLHLSGETLVVFKNGRGRLYTGDQVRAVPQGSLLIRQARLLSWLMRWRVGIGLVLGFMLVGIILATATP